MGEIPPTAVQGVLDVAIVGGGLAGTALAAVLIQRGFNVALFDLHNEYPSDFRAEKLTESQLSALHRLGLDGPVLAASTAFDEVWVARFGRVVERRCKREWGIDYAKLVSALRTLVPPEYFRHTRVSGIVASDDVQQLRLASGGSVTARLAVIATGLGRTLLGDVGIQRQSLSQEASMVIGFDLSFATCAARSVRAVTYFNEKVGDRSAYLTIFPIGDRARANLFVYRTHNEDWSRTFREQPAASLHKLMPSLRALIGPNEIVGRPVLRPIELYRSERHERAGVVLIGDAFATTCPTGGTGIDKVLTDVEVLTQLIPTWLRTQGMGTEKIKQYYADPAKQACERRAKKITRYARSMALDEGAIWFLKRWTYFHGQRLRSRIAQRKHGSV